MDKYIREIQLEYELASLEEEMYELGIAIGKYRHTVITYRRKKVDVMIMFGLTILPPVMEMKRKYPGLFDAGKNLERYELTLKKVELRMFKLRRKKKELERMLGYKDKDVEW